MLVCINKGASENDDDVENEDEIQVTRVCRFTALIIFYFNTAKSTYNIQKYQALPHNISFVLYKISFVLYHSQLICIV